MWGGGLSVRARVYLQLSIMLLVIFGAPQHLAFGRVPPVSELLPQKVLFLNSRNPKPSPFAPFDVSCQCCTSHRHIPIAHKKKEKTKNPKGKRIQQWYKRKPLTSFVTTTTYESSHHEILLCHHCPLVFYDIFSSLHFFQPRRTCS